VRGPLVQYVSPAVATESICCRSEIEAGLRASYTTASKCCRSIEVESQVVANGRFLGVGQRASICSGHYESLGNIKYKDGVAFTFSKEIPGK
jgi:hypothetical protein